MRDLTDYGAIVSTHSGKGEVSFPLGGKIQSYFTLVEYATGKRVLTCTGRFTKASYPGWERLVSQYQIEPGARTAQKAWLAERFAGRTDDEQQVTIGQMFLIGAKADEVGKNNLQLHMQFDCQDATLAP